MKHMAQMRDFGYALHSLIDIMKGVMKAGSFCKRDGHKNDATN